MLKVSERIQKMAPSIAVVLGFIAAFYFLSLCLKHSLKFGLRDMVRSRESTYCNHWNYHME